MSLFKKLQHVFLSYPGNGFQPRLLTVPVLAGLGVLLLTIQIVSYQITNGDGKVMGFATAVNSGELVELTNHERLEAGAPSLVVHPSLQRAAQLKADDMALRGYWSHS